MEQFMRRFSRHQPVNNVAILLFQLASICMEYLEPELYYGSAQRRGLATPFDDDRKERATAVAVIAMGLMQEVGMTKEDIMQAWDEAQKNREDLEQEIKRQI